MKVHNESQPVPSGVAVSPKLDGIYARATKNGLFTKSGAPIKTQPHLAHALKSHFLKNPESVLHGEIYRHGAGFDQIVSEFKSGQGKLEYHLHPGSVAPTGRHIKTIPTASVASAREAHAHYNDSLRQGYEGQVIQHPDGTLLKRKPRHDEEYTVTGSSLGRKHGILSVKDGEGRTFRVQAPAALAAGDHVGKAVTVSYVRKSRHGIPHAPVYKGMRDYEMGAFLGRLRELSAITVGKNSD